MFKTDFGVSEVISLTSSLLTVGVAFVALGTWRSQERQKAILQWKKELVDFAFSIPNLDKRLSWGVEADEELINRISERYYCCVSSFIVMRELVSSKKLNKLQTIWNTVGSVHQDLCFYGRISCSQARDMLAPAYLDDFIK